ncbi:MAG: LysR family transcriptional regulator [Acutalibacteraceae bacterium]
MVIFRSVCENGYNSTKAAEVLHMTQPAVSLAIKRSWNNITAYTCLTESAEDYRSPMRGSIFCNMRFIFPTYFQIWKQFCVIGTPRVFFV